MVSFQEEIRSRITQERVDPPTTSPTTKRLQEREARREAASFNFGVKLSRPGFGPPAEPAASSPA